VKRKFNGGAVVAYFKVRFRHLPRNVEEKTTNTRMSIYKYVSLEANETLTINYFARILRHVTAIVRE
jgi:hypothetical protein